MSKDSVLQYEFLAACEASDNEAVDRFLQTNDVKTLNLKAGFLSFVSRGNVKGVASFLKDPNILEQIKSIFSGAFLLANELEEKEIAKMIFATKKIQINTLKSALLQLANNGKWEQFSFYNKSFKNNFSIFVFCFCCACQFGNMKLAREMFEEILLVKQSLELGQKEFDKICSKAFLLAGLSLQYDMCKLLALEFKIALDEEVCQRVEAGDGSGGMKDILVQYKLVKSIEEQHKRVSASVKQIDSVSTKKQHKV